MFEVDVHNEGVYPANEQQSNVKPRIYANKRGFQSAFICEDPRLKLTCVALERRLVTTFFRILVTRLFCLCVRKMIADEVSQRSDECRHYYGLRHLRKLLDYRVANVSGLVQNP